MNFRPVSGVLEAERSGRAGPVGAGCWLSSVSPQRPVGTLPPGRTSPQVARFKTDSHVVEPRISRLLQPILRCARWAGAHKSDGQFAVTPPMVDLARGPGRTTPTT